MVLVPNVPAIACAHQSLDSSLTKSRRVLFSAAYLKVARQTALPTTLYSRCVFPAADRQLLITCFPIILVP